MNTTILLTIKNRDVLRNLSDLRGLRLGMEAAAQEAKADQSEYPPRSSRPQPFVSDRQRRGFFYHLRRGNIEVPYRRGLSPNSERFAQRWTVRTERGGLRVVLGNNTSYAALLKVDGQQTDYHRKTGWQTIGAVNAANMKKYEQIVVKYARQDFE